MKSDVLRENSKLKEKESFSPCEGIFSWDSLDSAILAATFIWAGLILLLNNTGFDIDTWPLFFLGAGLLVLIEIVIRLFMPGDLTSVTGDLIWAGMLFWFGHWNTFLAVVIILIGVYLIYKVRFQNDTRAENL